MTPDERADLRRVLAEARAEAEAEAAETAGCDHVGTGRIKKYDGGLRPILCARCALIVGRWGR